jgi:hypothetical protein
VRPRSDVHITRAFFDHGTKQLVEIDLDALFHGFSLALCRSIGHGDATYFFRSGHAFQNFEDAAHS